MIMYSINEIFSSIQGEGYHTGTKVIFVRFAGCNLNCGFCDTIYSEKIIMNQNELLSFLLQRREDTKINHIVLTGGEPGLQINSILIKILLDAGFVIQIETNGTIDLSEIDNINHKNVWVTCSPKKQTIQGLDAVNEIKIVFIDRVFVGDLIATYYQFDSYKDDVIRRFYIQPCEINCINNTEEVIEYIMKSPLNLRFSPQIQKLCNFL